MAGGKKKNSGCGGKTLEKRGQGKRAVLEGRGGEGNGRSALEIQRVRFSLITN